METGLPRHVVLGWEAEVDAARYATLLEAEMGRTPTVQDILTAGESDCEEGV